MSAVAATFRVAKFSEFGWIPLPSENGVDDCQTGDPGDVANDVMELDVHLIESLLHVLDVNRCQLYEALAVSPD